MFDNWLSLCSSWQDIPHQLQVWPLLQKIQTSATIIWNELYRVPVNLNNAVDFKILVIDVQSISQTSIISILKPSDICGHSKIISLRCCFMDIIEPSRIIQPTIESNPFLRIAYNYLWTEIEQIKRCAYRKF